MSIWQCVGRDAAHGEVHMKPSVEIKAGTSFSGEFAVEVVVIQKSFK